MPSIINALTASGGGVAISGDATGNLALQSAGNTAVTIDTSQNVGVGTTSPTDKLDVARNSGANSTGGLTLTNTSTSGYGSAVNWNFALNSVAGVNGRMYCEAASSTASFMAWQTTVGSTLAERMRITSGGNLTIGEATSDYRLNAVGSASQKGFRIRSGGNGGVTILDVADTNGNSGMLLQANGDFILASSYAQKASGTTWANPSDSRIKENVVDYTKGLNELAQINVKTWNYNGKAKTVAGTKGLGVIADEIMQVLPETVDTYKAKLNDDDETESDIKRFDATEITWLLVNAVKELNAKVEAQAAEIAALKGAK